MFFSINPNNFRSPKPCNLGNGTEVYYQLDALDCSCLAPIKADPDFAGAVTITSFIFIAWLTIAVAAIPTGRSLWMTWLRTKGPWRIWKWLMAVVQFEPNDMMQRRTSIIGFPIVRTVSQMSDIRRVNQIRGNNGMNFDDSSSSSDSIMDSKQPLPSSRPFINVDPEPPYCTFSRRIVLQLCDLQIFTGIAIEVSALAQYPILTFYHAQFAEQFWWLTLNSFWMSRIDYSRNTPEMNTWRAAARRTAIWVSVALSVALQSIITYREHSLWDPTVAGRCYMADGTGTGFGQNLFWLCGTGIYFLVMTFSMTPWTRKWWDEKVNAQVEPSICAMQSWMLDSYHKANAYRITSAEDMAMSKIKRMVILTLVYAKVASYALAWLTWWAFVLFISIWCAGNSAAAVELVIYSIFAGFLTWWIIYLKVQNTALIRGNENRMTFGQTLPLFLLVLCAFHALDVWAGVKRDEFAKRLKRRDEEATAAAAAMPPHSSAPELSVDFANPEIRSRIDSDPLPPRVLPSQTTTPPNTSPSPIPPEMRAEINEKT